MFGAAGQILELAGIAPEIEKQRRHPLIREVDVLVLSVTDNPQQVLVHVSRRLELPGGGAIVELVVDLRAEGIGSVTAHRRQQAPPLEAVIRFHTQPFEYGRTQVDRLDEAVVPLAGSGLGVADDAGDVHGTVEESALANQIVIAKIFAVVGTEDDQGIVPLTGLFQLVEDQTQVVIELADHAIIAGHELPQVQVVSVLA